MVGRMTTRLTVRLSVAPGGAQTVTAIPIGPDILPAAAPPPPRPVRRYRIANRDELLAAGAAIEVHPLLPACDIQVPAVSYGITELPPNAVQQPEDNLGASTWHQPGISRLVLHDAEIHTRHGIVTIGDHILADTMYHTPVHVIPGAARIGAEALDLPDNPIIAHLPEARHLLAGGLGNYYHWLVDVLLRNVPVPQSDATITVLPSLTASFESSSLELTDLHRGHALHLGMSGRVSCGKLHYVGDLSGAGFVPHAGMRIVADRLLRTALGDRRIPGGRRLFISRADSEQRRLVNETELIAVAAEFGFEPISLSGRSAAEQVELFTSASHIVAPHGAGLVNLLFCRPETAVLELHMDRYVNWVFRRLCGLRGLRYGCVIGTATPPVHDWVHRNSWLLDAATLRAAMHDPRFTA